MVIVSPLLASNPCFCNWRSVESSKLVDNVFTAKVKRRGFGRMGLERKWGFLDSRMLDRSRVYVQRTEQQTFNLRTEVDDLKELFTYRFRTEIGGNVKVLVGEKDGKYVIFVEVLSLELGASDRDRVILIWGLYRSDSSCFMPLDSASDNRTIETPFVRNSFGNLALELEFEAKQTPFYLSFLLKPMSSGLEIRNHRKANFCVPIGFHPGYPAPLGLSFSTDGSMNFAFYSRNATSVVLCLYDDTTSGKPALELDLDPFVNRSGDVWHALLEGAWTFLSYGYRCKGAIPQGDMDGSNARHVLLDPYAKIIVNAVADHGSSLLPNYLGQLCREPAFYWNGDIRPNLAMEELIVYRVNVMSFTKDKSSQLSKDVAGSFAGLIEKLSHFKDLGVNAVLLEPIFPFDERMGPYFPSHFFSPTNLYGPSSGSVAAISSLKEMVKKFHANGIEVLLEVVFTHTAEAGALKGIDDSSYYCTRSVADLESQNALNCNYPIVQRMILDGLRHWVTEFHIDGFCFINASSLLRGFHGEYLTRPPLVEAIAFDPLLSQTKIIADYWGPQELVPKAVSFPHWKRWAEINTKFCSDVRNFLRGEGLLSDLATRLCGSGDIFSSGRGPAFSFNFIARNSGLPLVDLVSFSGAELASELSWNCGEEGPTNKTPVLERRVKQIRNFLFILFVSLGVPVINMGDECGQSSGGSTSYGNRKPFDWNALSTGFGIQTTQFVSFLSSLRTRRSDLLQKRNFLKEQNIEWRGSDQNLPRWEDPSCKFLAMTLKVDEPEGKSSSESSLVKGDVFIAFNAAGHSESVTLPEAPEGMAWRCLIDTALPFPGFFSNDGKLVVQKTAGSVTYEMKSHSCTLFEACSTHDG